MTQTVSFREVPEVVERVDEVCGRGKPFRSRTHFLNQAVREQLARLEKERSPEK